MPKRKPGWKNFRQQTHEHLPALFIERTAGISERERGRPTNVLRCNSTNTLWRKRIPLAGMSSLSRSDKTDAFSLTGEDAAFDVSRWTWWKRSRRTYRGRCRRSSARKMSKVAAAMYRPRGLGGHRRRRLLWLSQSDSETRVLCRPFRRLPLSRCTVQNGILYVRESGDHQMKVYLRRLRPPRRVFHAYFFYSVSTPTSAPLQSSLKCWEWFISVTKKIKSIYGKWASQIFKLLSYSRTLILFKYKNNI